jgi:hypothetical protein
MIDMRQRYPSMHEQGDDQQSTCAGHPYEHIAKPKINIAGTHFAFAPV